MIDQTALSQLLDQTIMLFVPIVGGVVIAILTILLLYLYFRDRVLKAL